MKVLITVVLVFCSSVLFAQTRNCDSIKLPNHGDTSAVEVVYNQRKGVYFIRERHKGQESKFLCFAFTGWNMLSVKLAAPVMFKSYCDAKVTYFERIMGSVLLKN